jgi:mono/diheme cytochrome c family protein
MKQPDLRLNEALRKIGRKRMSLIALGLAMITLAGCRQDMHNQPKFKPLRESDFYADKRSARPIVEGTVARNQLDTDFYYYTGKVGNNYATEFPFPVTEQVLRRGQERFNIYCSPCHSEIGDGNGMIVARGFKKPPSYHTDRLRNAPVGHFFDVITNGFGAMGDYSEQVSVQDRWAIVAYIRALQLSQDATKADVAAGTQIASQPPDINVPEKTPASNPKALQGEGVAGHQGAVPK